MTLHNNMIEQHQNIKKNIRNSTFDMMKGLAIILMVVGHQVENKYINHIIYSFHMPLFFLIAGFFYRDKPILKSLKYDFKRLLIPYFIVGLVSIMGLWGLDQKFSFNWIPEGLKVLLWAKAYNHASPIWGEDIQYIGAIWFLFALFWTKNVFNIIVKFNNNILIIGLYCLVLSVGAVLIDKYIICLPLAILPGFSALIFYFTGYYFHRIDAFSNASKSAWYIFICLILWFLGIMLGTINIGTCYYKNPFFSVMGSIAACLVWYCIFNHFNLPILIYFGSVSLVVLCLHSTITVLRVRELLGITSDWWQVMFDLLMCMIIIPIMQKSEFFRQLFGLQRIDKFIDCFKTRIS